MLLPLSQPSPSWLNQIGPSAPFTAIPQSTMHVYTFLYICSKLRTMHQSSWKLSNRTAFFEVSRFLWHWQKPLHHALPITSVPTSSLLSLDSSLHKCLSFHDLICSIMEESLTYDLASSSPSLHITGAFISPCCNSMSNRRGSIFIIGE